MRRTDRLHGQLQVEARGVARGTLRRARSIVGAGPFSAEELTLGQEHRQRFPQLGLCLELRRPFGSATELRRLGLAWQAQFQHKWGPVALFRYRRDPGEA